MREYGPSPEELGIEPPPKQNRPGGPLQGKPIEAAPGQWEDKLGNRLPGKPNRPGGELEGKPVQGPDGKWYDKFGEEVSPDKLV